MESDEHVRACSRKDVGLLKHELAAASGFVIQGGSREVTTCLAGLLRSSGSTVAALQGI